MSEVKNDETNVINNVESLAPNETPSKSAEEKETPNEITNNSSPEKSEDNKPDEIDNNEDSISKSHKTPERRRSSVKVKHFSPTVDNTPMQKTKNLVDKWEIIKKDNEKLAKISQYETQNEKKAKALQNEMENEKKSTKNTPKTDSTTYTNVYVSSDDKKMKDHIPRLTKKFSMKEQRLRESIKRFNESYHTANIDLKSGDMKIVTVKPVIKEKRVYVEDEDEENKVQRSKRVKVSELNNDDNNTSIWHKINSSIHSLKVPFISKSNEKTLDNNKNSDNDNDNDNKEKVNNKKKGKVNENENVITPTVKNQEVVEPVRLNETTCLDIFNPTSNKSTIPVLLRLRRRSSLINDDDSRQSFAKSNTKAEWANKLFMVMNTDSTIPKLYNVPVHWTSLSAQMVYILNVSDEALIQYNGSKSKDSDKDYAQRICKRMSLNDNIPDIFEIDQDDSYSTNSVALKLFWKTLELQNFTDSEKKSIIEKNDRLNLNDVLEKNKENLDVVRAIYVYRINEQTNSLDLVHNGSFPTYRCLNSNISMIFDFAGEVYLWQGKNSSLNARSIGIKFAQKIFNDYKRPSWATLKKINEGHEPIIFQEKFKDSYLFF